MFAYGTGIRIISATAIDEDGTYAANTIQVTVNPSTLGPSVEVTPNRVLSIVGTDNSDLIRVTPQGKNKVQVQINGQSYGAFDLTKFDEIIIDAKAGDDDIEITPSIDKRAFIFGGIGDDRIKGVAGQMSWSVETEMTK